MKKLKKLSSILLAMTVLTGVTNSIHTVHAEENTSQSPMLLSEITSDSVWKTRIAAEKKKFPDYAYWNHASTASNGKEYTWTACNHDKNGKTYCNKITSHNTINDEHEQCKEYYDYQEYYDYNTTYQPEKFKEWSQCGGFARKVAEDIWDTKYFVRYKINDGKINYTADGTSKTYVPQKGDQIRLFSDKLEYDENGEMIQGHSIFITDIVGDTIYIVECNADLNTCQIRWNQTRVFDYELNKKVAITADYLRENAVFVERPYLQGDFNLNGKIDRNDYNFFQQTFLTNGRTPTGYNYTEYDVNGDLEIDYDDWNKLNSYANSSVTNGYVYTNKSHIKFRSRQAVPDGAFVYNNGIYEKLNSTTAAFIGTFVTSASSFKVDDYVIDPADGKKYKVTTIGDYWYDSKTKTYKPSSKTNLLGNVEILRIPETVTKITHYAFGCEPKLSSLKFYNTPELKTIEANAFYNCKDLFDIKLPSTVSAPMGATAKVTVNTTGNNLQYKWYYKNKNMKNFELTTTFKSNTYSVAMSEARDGRQIFCVVIDENGNAQISNVVTLSVS